MAAHVRVLLTTSFASTYRNFRIYSIHALSAPLLLIAQAIPENVEQIQMYAPIVARERSKLVNKHDKSKTHQLLLLLILVPLKIRLSGVRLPQTVRYSYTGFFHRGFLLSSQVYLLVIASVTAQSIVY